MGLSKKTFCYSILLSAVMLLFVVGYFLLMLPSLYVAHVQNSNYQSVISLQRQYMRDRNYNGLTLLNPSGTMTLEIPRKGNTLTLYSRMFQVAVTVRDDELLPVLEAFQGLSENPDGFDGLEDRFDLSLLKEKLFPAGASLEALLPADYPLQFELLSNVSEGSFEVTDTQMHFISNTLFVSETSVEDAVNQYTTYVAIGLSDDFIAISVVPAMTPRLDEILPVVTGSLPMITAVVFLLVLLSSVLFSRKIVGPILRISTYTEEIKESGSLDREPLAVAGRDEISLLADTLNRLYSQLRDNYRELEDKNRVLSDINKRQEVFLRASSHQLKTPVAAALLLTDGMINEVGKYKNVKEYLPEIKKQLKSMQKIIEDILYLNHCAGSLHKESFSLNALVSECLQAYQVQLSDKGLTVRLSGADAEWENERNILGKMIDNLLSNAVQYTPCGQHIDILLAPESLCIRNYGITIDEKLLPDIYEPFVSGNTDHKGHGLGLYVVSYYAGLCGCHTAVRNIPDGVEATLTLV